MMEHYFFPCDNQHDEEKLIPDVNHRVVVNLPERLTSMLLAIKKLKRGLFSMIYQIVFVLIWKKKKLKKTSTTYSQERGIMKVLIYDKLFTI